MKWLDLLEMELVDLYGPFNEDDVDFYSLDLTGWEKWPYCYVSYGPREGHCVGDLAPFYLDDPLLAIAAMFRIPLRVVADEVTGVGLGKSPFAVVEPSYDDTSALVVLDNARKKVLYYALYKAWDLAFEMPEKLNGWMEEIFQACQEAAKEVTVT